jgi:hypothetical protein
MDLARSLLALLLILTGSALIAADPPTVEQLKGGEPPTQISEATDQALIDHAPHHDLARLRGVSPLVGAVVLLIAAVPLFAGWLLLRLALGLLAGSFAAMAIWQYGPQVIPSLSGGGDGVAQLGLIVLAVAGFLVGFAVGWVLYRLQLGLAGALLGLMVLSLPGVYLDWAWLTLALMAVGAVLGFIAGWIAAPYWAALQMAILGGFLVVQGTAILAQPWHNEDSMRVFAYGAGLAAAAIGFIVQAVGIVRHRAPPPAPHAAAPAH